LIFSACDANFQPPKVDKETQTGEPEETIVFESEEAVRTDKSVGTRTESEAEAGAEAEAKETPVETEDEVKEIAIEAQAKVTAVEAEAKEIPVEAEEQVSIQAAAVEAVEEKSHEILVQEPIEIKGDEEEEDDDDEEIGNIKDDETVHAGNKERPRTSNNNTSSEAVEQLEKTIAALGGFLERMKEGAVKSKQQAAMVASTAALALAEAKPAPIYNLKTKSVAESKRHAATIARTSMQFKTKNEQSDLFNAFGSAFALFVNPVKEIAKSFRAPPKPKATIFDDKLNNGHMTDADFEKFMAWWSPAHKQVVAKRVADDMALLFSKDNNGEISDDLFQRFMEMWSPLDKPVEAIVRNDEKNNGHLSDELFDRFLATWSPTTKSVSKPEKQQERMFDGPNGELSDQDFERFLSVWSTIPTKAPPTKRARMTETNNGLLTDEDFQTFMQWCSTQRFQSRPSNSSIVRALSDRSNSVDDGASITSVNISISSDIASQQIPELTSEEEEVDEWNLVEEEIIANVNAVLGSSSFQQEAPQPFLGSSFAVSHALDDGMVLSRSNSMGSISLVSAAQSEEDGDDFSVISSKSSASIISFDSCESY